MQSAHWIQTWLGATSESRHFRRIPCLAHPLYNPEMEKLIYLIFPPEGLTGPDYRDQLITRLSADEIFDTGVKGINVSVNDLLQKIPRLT